MENSATLAKGEKALRQEAINSMPLACWKGSTILIHAPEEVTEAVARLNQKNVLGFDTETRPAFRKGEKYPVSLLQLAGENVAFLFQLSHIGLSSELCALLMDKNIIKTGVGLSYDVQMLRELRDFTPQGFVDLATMARSRGISQGGLRGLAATLLGLRISKSARISNWAADVLSPQQIRYAATDAWISRKIYFALQKLPILKASPTAKQESPLHSSDV